MSIGIGAIREQLQQLGAKRCHEDRQLRLWTQGLPADAPVTRPEHQLPRSLSSRLDEFRQGLDRVASAIESHEAEDGARRLLVQLVDGQTIETVLLPRDGVCVSTQVGCAVGCQFCMTGQAGLLRQLGSAEIVAQVALAQRRQPIRKVVFMGMGEPAHNLDAVLEAIDLLGTLTGIAHKNLVFSTVGDRRAFERLPTGRVRPALALSLHTTDADLRRRLLPRAPNIAPDELVRLAQDYSRMTGYPVQYQWTLLEGVNDTEAEIEGIARLLAGQYAVMNLIPFNEIDADSGFRRPDWEHAAAMARALHRKGVLTKLRRSAGQDVRAGCGQLRARSGGLSQSAGQAEKARSGAGSAVVRVFGPLAGRASPVSTPVRAQIDAGVAQAPLAADSRTA